MREFWRWFWGGFAVAFAAGFVRDPVKVLLGCGCLGLIIVGAVLSAISWRLGGLGTLLALIAVVAVIAVIRNRRE